MKITIKRWKIEINKSRIVLFFSPIIYMWMVWQHEILMKNVLPNGQTFLDWVWNMDFAFFTGIHLQWGTAYDFTLLGQAIAYFMLFALVISRGRKKKEPINTP